MVQPTDAESTLNGYTYKMRSKKFELPDLTPLLMQDKGSVNPLLSLMLKQLSDFFNLSIKEMTVTVVYTIKKKTVDYSATTFLVDYNQVLPLPNLGGGGAGGGAASGGQTGGTSGR